MRPRFYKSYGMPKRGGINNNKMCVDDVHYALHLVHDNNFLFPVRWVGGLVDRSFLGEATRFCFATVHKLNRFYLYPCSTTSSPYILIHFLIFYLEVINWQAN